MLRTGKRTVKRGGAGDPQGRGQWERGRGHGNAKTGPQNDEPWDPAGGSQKSGQPRGEATAEEGKRGWGKPRDEEGSRTAPTPQTCGAQNSPYLRTKEADRIDKE